MTYELRFDDGQVEEHRDLRDAIDRLDALAGQGLAIELVDDEGAWVFPCSSCGGRDPEGGSVALAGPDEFGNYDAVDCPDHAPTRYRT